MTQTSAAGHPIVERLLQIAGVEQAKQTTTRQNVAEARLTVAAAEATLASALDALATSEQADALATERVSAVLSTVDAAVDYVQRVNPQDMPDDAPGMDEAQSGAGTATRRTITDLILDALSDGQLHDLSEVGEAVRRRRPGTKDSSVRKAITDLRRQRLIETVDRGQYRLAEEPEGNRPTE